MIFWSWPSTSNSFNFSNTGQMRVIAGLCKGQRLAAPHQAQTRPTSDRVKTIMFDIIGSRVLDAVTLDLFAGSGSLGIEALSRGARRADFVEAHGPTGFIIRKNLQATHLDNHARVIINDAFLFLERERAEENYDLALIDPPYERGFGERTLRSLLENNRLASGAWVVIEESVRVKSVTPPEDVRLIKQRIVGDTVLYFFEAR
jgi:16S rRNA (guanine966-N2)-methyltransferase